MKNIFILALTMFSLGFSGISRAADLNPHKSYRFYKLNNPIKETPRGFTIAFELNSGLRDSKNIVNPFYTGSVRMYGEFSYLKNKARIEPFIGSAFENPGGSFEIGLRNDFRLFPIKASNLPIGEIRAGLSYYYSTYKKINVVGIDVQVEAIDLIFLSLRFNKSLNSSDYSVMPGFGINL